MTFLPIVARELRVRSRQAATWWGRGIVALLVFLVMVPWVLLEGSMIGGTAYDVVAAVAFALVLLGGLLTMDSISGERREGTLGLLFLTDLRGHDVVTGKMVVNALWAFYAVIGLIPVLAVTFAIGGVTGGELFRLCLLLLATLFLSLAIGALASAHQVRLEKAAGRFLLWMLIIAVAPLLVGALVGRSTFGGEIAFLSPLELFRAADDVRYLSQPSDFWKGLLAVVVLGFGAVAVAAWRLRVNWRDQTNVIADSRTRANRKPLLDEDPMLWLLQNQRGQTALAWVALILGCDDLTGLMVRWFGSTEVFWYAFWLLSNLGFTGILAWVSGRFFLESRRTGLMELLLTVPEGARRVAQGQWMAIRKLIKKPLLFVMVWTAASALWSFVQMPWTVVSAYATYRLVALLMIPLQVVAICWTAMRFGLRYRTVPVMILATFGCTVLLPWVVALAGYVMLRAGEFAAVFQIVLTGTVYGFLIRWARRGVYQQLASGRTGNVEDLTGFGHFWRRGLSLIRRVRHWS